MTTRILAASILVGLSSGAFGQTVGTRDIAMGGVGVATSRTTTALFVNPALAHRFAGSQRAGSGGVQLVAPIFSFIATDGDDLRAGTDELQRSVEDLQALIAAGDPAADTLRPVVADQLARLEGREIFVDSGLGLGLVIPRGETFSLGLSWRTFVDLRASTVIDPTDFTTIANTTNAADLETLSSEVVAPSARVQEFGLTVGKSFEVLGRPASFGITPKFQSVETYQLAVSVSNFDESDLVHDFDDESVSARDESGNIDLGVAIDVAPAVRAGLAVTNMIGHTFDAPMRNGRRLAYQLEPLPTLGVAFETVEWTAAFDLDLASTSRFEGLGESQFVRLGAEYRTPGWIAVRGGYSYDLEDTQQDLWSFGLGFPTYWQGPLDVALVVGEHSFGASLQFGWSF